VKHARETKDAKGMAILLGWWGSGVNAMREYMSVLDGFHPFDSLILPAFPLLKKPHHLT
jgi:hypothetical protein